MTWLDIVLRVLVPSLIGALAVGAGTLRVPWTPPDEEDRDPQDGRPHQSLPPSVDHDERSSR
ncbi:hypothetical protein ACIGN6_31870 [Streptomyces sp. NPDC053792]|uniref:hypothetical protein n=1 Tax=Streptomyces sp. NPDC053792 TaxID=3365716 RepID=UPI0037D3ABBA